MGILQAYQAKLLKEVADSGEVFLNSVERLTCLSLLLKRRCHRPLHGSISGYRETPVAEAVGHWGEGQGLRLDALFSPKRQSAAFTQLIPRLQLLPSCPQRQHSQPESSKPKAV